MPSARHPRRLRTFGALGGAMVVVSVLLLCAASSAFAAEVHARSSSFGAGELELGERSGLAINQTTDDVYVTDTGHGRVAEFEPDGTFVRAFGSFATPSFIAVDNSASLSNGAVYVVDSATKMVSRFDAEGNPSLTWASAGQLTLPEEIAGIAVDASGDLWVYDMAAQMREYSSAGVLITEWNSNLGVTPAGIAVDSAGNLYVVRGNSTVQKFSSAGADEGEADSCGCANGLAIDNGTDDLYLSHGSDLVRISAGGSTLEGSIGGGEGLTFAAGVAIRSSDAALFATDTTASQIVVFTLQDVEPPIATIEAPSPVEYSTAHVAGEVDPEGHQASCRFQYVTDAHFIAEGFTGAQSTPCASSPGSGTSPVPVEADLAGLSPHTTYHVRLAATNPAATVFSAEPNPTFETKTVVAPAVSIESNLAHTASTAHLVGHVNPNAPGAAPGQDPAFDVAWHFECIPSCPEEGTLSGNLEADDSSHEVSADVAELTPGTTYEIRLVAENAGGAETRQVAGPATFTTMAAVPVISATSVSGVGPVEATFHATINPRGGATTYHFEFLTEAQFQADGEAFGLGTQKTVESASIGSDNEDHEAAATITGLQPETAYVFRVVATNAAAPGGVVGPVKAFTTRSVAPPSSGCPNEADRLGLSAGLPDCRAFEAVSPVATEGSAQTFIPAVGQSYFSSSLEHGITTPRPFDVAANGQSVTYLGDSPPAGGTGGARSATGNQYLGRKRSAGGWEQVNINPGGLSPQYLAFSGDLSKGFVRSTETLAAAVPPNAYANIYRHPTVAGAGGPYQPLFDVTPPNRSTNDGETGFNMGLGDGDAPLLAGFNSGTQAVAALSHVIFAANDVLVPEQGVLGSELKAAVEANIEGGQAEHLSNILYDSFGGSPHVVSVLPNGTGSAHAFFGSPPTNTRQASALDHAISDDGSRIFWTDAGTGGLYVREHAAGPESVGKDGEGNCIPEAEKACSVQLDRPNSDTLGEGGGGQFRSASADGSLVFFTDNASAGLTADTAPGSGSNLYVYDFAAAAGHHLSDLSVAAESNVLGLVGTSEDGSYVYFVAEGVLAANRVDNGGGFEEAEAGRPNLYLSHGGTTTFITALSSADGEEVVPFNGAGEGFESGDWSAASSFRTAQVTPDGRSLIFLSNRSLTGYDNRQTAFNPFEGRTVTTALDEIFAYQADAGALGCVSCDPSGAAPVPSEFNTYRPAFGTPVGSYFPITKARGYRAQPRVMTEDGSRIFFDSGEPLVPEDVNGWMDVYEWERSGTGSCHRASGCIFLISGGTGHESSYLLGASTSGPQAGDDAFIITRAQLVAPDRNEGFDVYDARVGGISPPAETPPCEGEACRETLATPLAPQSPGTSTFSGLGNPQPVKCKKGKIRKHGKCVSKRRKSKHHKGNKRHGSRNVRHNGGGGK